MSVAAVPGRRFLVFAGVAAAAFSVVAARPAQTGAAAVWLDALLCRTREPGTSPAERRRAQHRRWAHERAASTGE